MDIMDIGRRTVSAATNTSNNARNELRKCVREIINAEVDNAYKTKFQIECGVTITKMIDQVHRTVLVNIVAYAMDDDLEVALNCIKDAYVDDDYCMPSPRGGSYGVSRGWHKRFMEESDAVGHINRHLDDTGIDPAPEGSVAACVVARTAYESAIPDFDWMDVMLITEETLGVTLAEKPIQPSQIEDYDDFVMGIDEAEQAKLDDAIKKVLMAMRKTKQSTATAAMITVDPAHKATLDTLLEVATGKRLNDMDVLIEAHGKVAALEEEVSKLQAAAAQPRFASTGASEVDGSTLTYEVVMRPARDIFLDPNGRKTKKLAFDIPTLVWTDEDGNEVRHPDCPPVDDTYQFRMYMLIKYLSAVVMGENVWLHGHTGTGKTTFIEQVAARVGFPVERLNLDSNLERADVVGGQAIEVEDGSPVTRYVEGILPRAMQQPYWFIMDECDAGRADMLFVVQRALEGKGLTITEDAGRTVEQHELFRFVATANSRGQGDEFGFYAGVRPMNIAFLNRFGMFVEVPYLDKDDEERLLEKAYPALTDVERSEFAEFARKVRAAFLNGEISQTMSPRNLHAMAKYYLHFKNLMSEKDAKKEAVAVAIVDAAPADNRHTIERLFENLTA